MEMFEAGVPKRRASKSLQIYSQIEGRVETNLDEIANTFNLDTSPTYQHNTCPKWERH